MREQYALAADELERNIIKMQAIENAGKTASSLTRRTQKYLEGEVRMLLEKYALDQMLTSLVTGATSSVLTVVGIKTGEDLFKELLTILLPIYKGSNEGTALEYLMEYLRGIYDKLTTECDM